MGTVDTRAVTDRRSLRFASLDDLLSDAQRCADADHAGTLRRSGNWSLGQTLDHLASWIDYGFDGYPFRPAFVLRLLGPLIKRQALRGLTSGVRIPGAPDGTYATDAVSTEEGLAHLRRSVERLKGRAPTIRNPVFGPMTHEEWRSLHLRHAELHLSFMHPG
jgi:hypothetical protein